MIVFLSSLLLVASGRGRHVPLLSVLPLLLLVSVSEQQSPMCQSGHVKHKDEHGEVRTLKIDTSRSHGNTNGCINGIILTDIETNKAPLIHKRFMYLRDSTYVDI